jgi:hypothetical protein
VTLAWRGTEKDAVSGLGERWARQPRLRVMTLALSAFLMARLVSLSALLLVGRWRGMPLGELVSRWDGVWYRWVAEAGYRPHPLAAHGELPITFFPLYPLSTRPLLALGLHFPTAGLLVVLAAGALASVLIAVVAHEVGGERVAVGTAALWSGHPAAYVLSVTYSEALFTALAAGCLLGLLKKRWLVAGLCAALASATRPTWVALALACGAAYVSQWAWERRRYPLASALPVLVAPLGAVAYYGYLWRQVGISPLKWLENERAGWGVHMDGGLYTLYWTWHVFDTSNIYPQLGHPFLPLLWVPLVLAATVLGVVLLVRDRAPVPLTLYAGALALLAFLTAGNFSSLPRVLLPAFPALIPLVRRCPIPLVVVVWLASLGVMSGLGVLEFAYLKVGDPAP